MGIATGFILYYWILQYNQNLEAAVLTCAAFSISLIWVGLRQIDRKSTVNDLDTFKDLIVSAAISALIGYVLYLYGDLRIAAEFGGILTTAAVCIILFREDAKKMALKGAGKT